MTRRVEISQAVRWECLDCGTVNHDSVRPVLTAELDEANVTRGFEDVDWEEAQERENLILIPDSLVCKGCLETFCSGDWVDAPGLEI